MSHHAPIRAILQHGLKSTSKIVHWRLCDRQNPVWDCFLTEVWLAAVVEISASFLIGHLAKLDPMAQTNRSVSQQSPRIVANWQISPSTTANQKK